MLFTFTKTIVDLITGALACASIVMLWSELTYTRIPFRISNILHFAAGWLVSPLRRIMPPVRIDFTPAVSLVLAALLSAGLDCLLMHFFTVKTFAYLAIVSLITWIKWVITASLVLEAVCSWIGASSDIAAFVASLNYPLLAPVRRFVPSIANIDFSPLIVLFLVRALAGLAIKGINLVF